MSLRCWVGTSLLLACLVPGDTFASKRVVTQCILVRNVAPLQVRLSDLTEIERNQWQVAAGQQLMPGSLDILVIRQFSEDEGVADSQHFTKLTAVIPDAESLTTSITRLDNANFSSGWSGYAYRADAWTTTNASLELTPTVKSNEISVSGMVDARNEFRRNSQAFPIKITCDLRRARFKNLTAWEGGRGSLERTFYP